MRVIDISKSNQHLQSTESLCVSYNSLSCQQNKMALNLNRNGSFIERRKMYVEFPFHNLQSSLPIDWHTPDGESLLKAREAYEQAYLKNIYNQRVNKQIQEKYKRPIDTFRAIPNELTLQKERDALSKELQQFNSNRVLSAQKNNPQPKDQAPGASYKSQPELLSQLQLQKKITVQKGSPDLPLNTYDHNPQSIDPQRYASLQKCKDPYDAQKRFNRGLMNDYRRYVSRSPDSPESHSIRNLMPDKLSQFLRQRVREDRRSVLRASISHSRNLPHP